MTHVTCRLTAKNRDQLRNPTLGNRVWATFLVTEKRWCSQDAVAIGYLRPRTIKGLTALTGAPYIPTVTLAPSALYARAYSAYSTVMCHVVLYPR